MKATRFGLAVILGLLFVRPLNHAVVAQNGETHKDEEPGVLDFEDMRYPAVARLKHTEGTVVLRVKLDKDGEVVGAEALSGPKDLVPDCLKNVKTWRFTPSSRDNAVAVYWFHIEGVCHGYGSSQFAFFGSNFARITSCEAHVEP